MNRPRQNAITTFQTSMTALFLVCAFALTAWAGEQRQDNAYARALDFADRGLYRQAASEIRSFNGQQPGNLDAWKMRDLVVSDGQRLARRDGCYGMVVSQDARPKQQPPPRPAYHGNG